MKLELIQALGHAAEGQTVGWVGSRWHEISDDFQAADTTCQAAASRICRANGMQEINFPNGGRILFLTPHRVRGITLDRAYMPAHSAAEDALMVVLPSLATSSDGALVTY
jgi:hypothetical protein